MLVGTSHRMKEFARSKGLKQIRIVTFGAPRVGDSTFVRHVENDPLVHLERYSTDCDPVVRLPPSFLGYSHAGMERLLHKGGDFTTIFHDGHRPTDATGSFLNLDHHCHGLALYRVALENMMRHVDGMGIDVVPSRLPSTLSPDLSQEAFVKFTIDAAVEELTHGTVFHPQKLHDATVHVLQTLDVLPSDRNAYNYVKQQLLHRTYASNHHRNETSMASWY